MSMSNAGLGTLNQSGRRRVAADWIKRAGGDAVPIEHIEAFFSGRGYAMHRQAAPIHHPGATMTSQQTHTTAVINLADKFGKFGEQWSPRVIAELNDYQLKIVRIEGDFIWHSHPETDEAFLVIEGELRIDFRDGHVLVGPGELFIVPKGVEHKPSAEREVKTMLIEPRGILNTGHAGGERTALNDVWV
jgi:mannose-6-phosphate isomerase-like protein (cupin superfamily)